MAKIHTHYDNLKVARLAPQEVIRAAYKALSQKYHPDKNPGDEKAARIMAILNSAYGTLADPQRRREHDEWIAAEEWEIEWLESTRHEESRAKPRQDGPPQAWDEAEQKAPASPWARRDWKWWASLGGCLVLGWCVGVLMFGNPPMLASVLGGPFDQGLDLRARARAEERMDASQAGDKPEAKLEQKPEPKGEPKGESKGDAIIDSWAVAKAASAETPPQAPDIKVVALAQVTLAPAPPECERKPQALVAPNGEVWPLKSGYVAGYPVWNKGQDLQLTVDNSGNASPVFVKLFDTERHANVRHLFVLPHDKLLVDNLTIGKYEVHYQNIDLGAGGKVGCGTPAMAPADG
ncbi:MAG TPA: J domain-containing protein [Janthinobacterium sp.]|jgi:curved DNA-binding protein CbpA|nr:J domain-containing protein [Janthinobacterium sp.]